MKSKSATVVTLTGAAAHVGNPVGNTMTTKALRIMKNCLASASIVLLLIISPCASAQQQAADGESGIKLDNQSVNVVTGTVYPTVISLKLGDGEYQEIKRGSSWRNSFNAAIGYGGTYYNSALTKFQMLNVTAGTTSESFSVPWGMSLTTGPFTPINHNGATLSYSSGDYIYTQRDGTVIHYISGFPASYTITRPNGEKITVTNSNSDANNNWTESIVSSMGYAFRVLTQPYGPTQVVAINRSVDYCDPAVVQCTGLTQNWPTMTFNIPQPLDDGKSETVTDASGVVTTFTYHYPSPGNYSIVKSVNGAQVWTYVYPPNGNAATSITKAGQTWSYAWTFASGGGVNGCADGPPPGGFSAAITDPLGHGSNTIPDQIYGNILKYTDENGRTFQQLLDSNCRIQYYVPPEGVLNSAGTPTSGYTQFTYDLRGNITQTTKVPKAGSSLPPIVKTAGFDATCSNPKTCNQPNWTRDALNNQTDFTYDANSGGLLSEMGPPPSSGAPRPLKLRTYASRAGWFKNASGTLTQSADTVWLIASETLCQTVAGGNSPVCDSAAPQRVTTYEYGASGTGEALLVKGIAVSSGGTTLRACYSYDVFLRRVSQTQPNANLGACP